MKGVDYNSVASRYAAGATTYELGREFGVNPVTIWRALSRRGISMRPQGSRNPATTYKPKSRSAELDSAYAAIAKFYRNGHSLAQTAEAFDVGVGCVRHALKERDIVGRTIREGQRLGIKRSYGQNAGKPVLAKRVFDHDKGRELYSFGKSLSEIGRELGAQTETVRKALHVMGVKLRPRGTQKGKPNHPIRGGKRITAAGYIYKRADFHGDVRGLEHRVIAARLLGRKLKPGEVVHHVYCDRADNKNLVICGAEYHVQLHARMRAHPYWSQFERK